MRGKCLQYLYLTYMLVVVETLGENKNLQETLGVLPKKENPREMQHCKKKQRKKEFAKDISYKYKDMILESNDTKCY